MERRIRRDVYSFRFRKPLPGSGVGLKNPEARSPLLVAIAGMHKDFSSHGTCERSRFLDDDQRSLQVPTGALFNATANSSATPMMVLVKRRESPRKMSMWRNDIPFVWRQQTTYMSSGIRNIICFRKGNLLGRPFSIFSCCNTFCGSCLCRISRGEQKSVLGLLRLRDAQNHHLL